MKGYLDRLMGKMKYHHSDQMRLENTSLEFLNSYKIKWSKKRDYERKGPDETRQGWENLYNLWKTHRVWLVR